MCSTLDPTEVAPYGVLTMVKRKHRPQFQSLDLPSRMGRRLLLTHLEFGGDGVEGGEGGRKGGVIEEWTIGNVHLESLDSVALRAEQLRKAGVSLSVEEERVKNVVLCGDFNFCSERNYDIYESSQRLEDDGLPLALPYFQDLWPLVKKGTKEEKEGFTLDEKHAHSHATARPANAVRQGVVAGSWTKRAAAATSAAAGTTASGGGARAKERLDCQNGREGVEATRYTFGRK